MMLAIINLNKSPNTHNLKTKTQEASMHAKKCDVVLGGWFMWYTFNVNVLGYKIKQYIY